MFLYNGQQHLLQYKQLEFDSEDPFDLFSEENIVRTSTVAIRLIQEMDDPLQSVFIIAESLCSENDNFSKKVGRDMACGRIDAFLLRESAADKVEYFTLGEAFEGQVYENSPEDDEGNPIPLSMVLAPFTESTLEWGLMHRLTRLMSEVGQEIVRKIVEDEKAETETS